MKNVLRMLVSIAFGDLVTYVLMRIGIPQNLELEGLIYMFAYILMGFILALASYHTLRHYKIWMSDKELTKEYHGLIASVVFIAIYLFALIPFLTFIFS